MGKLNFRLKALLHKYGLGMLFYLPFFILFFVFTIIPVLICIGMSFTNYDMLQIPEFVGFNNYKLLFLTDDIFMLSLKNTFIIAVIAGPTGYIASFMFAWVINNLKMKNTFALAFYAPSITSGVAMATVWLYFFSGDRYGLINNTLMNLGLISEPVIWNQNPDTILPIVILIQIWMSMGTGFLVFLAGLQNTQKELYEAGRMDGVKNAFQELYYITLPQMKPQLLFGAISATVGAFGVFDIAAGFAGFPSTNYAAHTIVAHMYDYGFIRFEMGYASSIAVFLFAITFIIGQLFIRFLTDASTKGV
ncbi:MAG: carbohydrate ABC transporter permease [Saccharofermentanales bacterium]